MITVSKEDYLKAILEAESEGETVISATLAHWLKVSPPAVTMAVRRLKKDGLVRVNTDGRVRLTAAGKKIARKLTVRHHLIERMLAEIFGMEWWDYLNANANGIFQGRTWTRDLKEWLKSDKEVESIKLDPYRETADINESNNTWKTIPPPSKFLAQQRPMMSQSGES